MGFADKSQWEYVAEAMIKAWPGLQTEGDDPIHFQFTGVPMDARWGDGTDLGAWQLGNNVPANLDGFYQTGTYQVADSYKQFIGAIEPKNFQQDDTYKQYAAQFNAAVAAGQTIYSNAVQAFSQLQERHPEIAKGLTFFTWLETKHTDGPGYAAKMDANQLEQDQAAKLKAEQVASVNPGLSDAKKAVLDPANMTKFVNKAGDKQSGLITTIEPINQKLKDWVNRSATDTPDLDVTINAETLTTGSWKKSVHTEIHKSCSSVSTTTTIDYARILTDKKFNAKITAVGASIFDISRGTTWFQPSWLSGDEVQLNPLSNLSMENFFGEKGNLHMVPTKIFVAYKPKVVITITTSTYEEHIKDLYHADAGLSLFGFKFSLAEGEDKYVEHGPSNTTTLTFDSFDDPAAAPQIYGVSSQSFYRP